MINMPVEELIRKIKEKTGLSEQEIEGKIKTKLEALSGLISKEGAAHIIANELGIDLSQARGTIKIKDLLPGMRNVEANGKVIKKYELRKFDTGKRKGQLSKCLVADETSTTVIVMWNEQAELINKFQEGDIIKIKGATVRSNNGKNELHLSESSELQINPEGLKIVSQSKENYAKPDRKKISELTEQDNNVEVFGTIVQVFDPKFFRIDPESGRRLKEDISEKPEAYGFVMNIFLDDGSDNIRTVLWKNQVLNLIGLSEQEILKFKDNPQEFEKIKTDLLGMMVKFIGRVSKNELFGRLEFVANVVLKEVNPEEEINKIESQKQEVKSSEKLSEKNIGKEEKKEKTVSYKESSEIEDDLLSLEDIEDLEEDL